MAEKKEDSSTPKGVPPNVESGGKVDYVKWFSELNKDSGKVAGGKGANLAEIFNLGVPVPPGFVITAQAYDYFIEKSGLKKKIMELLGTIKYENTKQLEEITKKVREMIVKVKFPEDLAEEVIESYENLDVEKIDVQKGLAHDILKNSAEPIFVAVRSSATAEDLAEASFAGQQDSFLNVKGKDDLLRSIKKCFASLFTARATYYRNKQGFKHEEVSLAVVIQKMVDSDKSGVIFSKDPAQKNDDVIMEAVLGLGEGIVSGQITPDRYVISRELEVTDKTISDKKIAVTRDSGGGRVVVKLTDERSNSQVLKTYEIKKLAEFALKLEEHYQKPQDVEFAIEGEEIFIVQTRPITTLEKRKEAGEHKELKGEVVVSGLAASPGVAAGRIKVIEELSDLDKLKEGDILVTKMTNPDMVVSMQKASAIVTDEGGMTAHAAIVSREMGIPCVVGTRDATTKLKEGELATVDGTSGKVYKGKIAETAKKEILPVTVKTKTKIKVIVDLPNFAERASKTNLKQVGLTRMEGIIAESGKHPNYFKVQNKMQDYEEIIFKGINQIANYFDEMWVRTSDIRSDEFGNLEGAPQEKEANPMLGMHGVRFSVKHLEILKAELNALKRVADSGKTMGLLLPQVISVEEVQEVKKALKEIDFNDAKVGVMVETPAAVQIIRELCAEGIDFISFGTNDLTQYMLAIDRGNEQVQHLYNEMHPAILYQLEYVIRVCKRNNVESSICGQAGSRKPMAKFLVEKGIDSISVNADMAKEISEYVLELEEGLVKGTDKEPRQYQPTPEEKANGFVKPQNVKKPEDPVSLGVTKEVTRTSNEVLQTIEGEGKEPEQKIEQKPVAEEKKLENSEFESAGTTRVYSEESLTEIPTGGKETIENVEGSKSIEDNVPKGLGQLPQAEQETIENDVKVSKEGILNGHENLSEARTSDRSFQEDKERIEKDVEAIEEEKKEYLETPEGKEEVKEEELAPKGVLPNDELGSKEHEPEFKEQGEIDHFEKEKDEPKEEVLDIF